MNTRNKNCRWPVCAITASLLLAAGAALADPPGRVARLAYVNGAVSLAPSGSNDWVQAGVNRPLMPGDRLWADPGGRDEVQIGSAALRMDGGTLVSVLNLDDRTTQFQLTQGRAYLRVSRLDPGEVMEVDTPNLALSIRKPGVYRLEVDPNGGSTVVTVRSGQAEAYGDGNAYLIDPGQSYRFGGTNLQDYQYAQVPPNDDFENWAAQRDRRRDNAVARRYVSPELIGYEDLDDNGSWRNVPAYGNVWVPSHVSPDWAPYRDGHWSWVDPWGWTWVDDAPWGFAVSHYGRWTRLDTGWGWVPGPQVARPVYAPALVAFVGGAALALEARREPGVAWFPLGPRDVYRPQYRASPRYVTNINVSNTVINRTVINKVVNVTNVTNVNYANRQVPGAVTAVPAQAFVHAQPVRQAAVALNRQQLAKAPVVNQLALAPQADSRAGGQRAHGAPPAAVVGRQVIAHTAPKLPPMPQGAPSRGLPRPDAVAMAAAAPQVKVLHPFKAGKPLAAPPPPRALAAATPQQQAGQPAGQHAGQHMPQQALQQRPQQALQQTPQQTPQQTAQPASQLAQLARHAPWSQPMPQPAVPVPPQGARPPLVAEQSPHTPVAMPGGARPSQSARVPAHGDAARPPQQIAALQPRPQPPHIELPPHPQPPQHAEPLPHAPQPQHGEPLARALPSQRGEPPHLPPAHPEAARPPQQDARTEALRPPHQAARADVPRPPQQAAHAEAPRPPQQAARADLPHPPQQAARAEAPQPAAARAEPPHPQPAARPEPPHPQPPREAPRQMAMAKPAEPPHHAPPPEAHRPAPPPAEAHHPQQAAPQPHPPAAKPEKDKRKDKHED